METHSHLLRPQHDLTFLKCFPNTNITNINPAKQSYNDPKTYDAPPG